MVTKVAHKVKTTINHTGPPKQIWYNYTNLSKSGVFATCGKITTDINSTLPIAGKNGTFNKPGVMELTNFGFDLQNGTKVEKVIVHYAHNKDTISSSKGLSTYPSFAGPTISLLNTDKKVTGNAVPIDYTHFVAEFTDVTLEQINNENFGVDFDYPINSSTNPGTLNLGDVSIEIVTSLPKITVVSTTSQNKVIKGALFSVEFAVSRLENIAYNPNCVIDFDNGLSFVKKISGVGTVESGSDTNSVRWDSSFTNSNTNKVVLQFRADTDGTKNISITDVVTNKTYTLKISVVNYTTSVSTTLNKKNIPVKINTIVNYDININTNNPNLSSQTITVQLPLGTEIANSNVLSKGYGLETSTTSTNTVLSLTTKINNGAATIPMSIKFKSSGLLSQQILISNVIFDETNILVQNTSTGKLGFSRLTIPNTVTENMGNNLDYSIFTVARYSNNSTLQPQDYKNNLRIGVFNSSATLIHNEDSFIDNVIWHNKIATANMILYENKVHYNKEYPLIMVYSHDYTNTPVRENLRYDFTEPIIIETDQYKQLEEYKDFPKPISALLANGDYATCMVSANSSTNPVLLYDYDSGGRFEIDNFICQGITVEGNYTTNNPVELQIELLIDGKRGYRNIMLEEGSGVFSLGNRYDLFGLSPHDLREKMQNLLINLVLNNPYDEDVRVNLNNITVTCTYFYMTDTGYGFEVEGERSEEYGIYFTDFDYNVGTKNELKMYQVTGTDDTIPYRMNVTDKEITLEIGVDDCDLEETMHMVDKIVKLFTNKRHQLTNKPQEKSIIFDIMPDRRFWFVREDDIDSKYGDGSFEGKIKLVIPSGTAQSIKQTVTGSGGANTGNVAVTPVIRCISKTGGTINITERYRGQSVIINNDDGTIQVGDKIIIYNEQPHRVTMIKQGTNIEQDITHLVNYSTTWFSLLDEYLFESDDAIITSVEYYEEW